MDDRTLKHKEIWRNKKILREVYYEWYKWIEKDLSKIEGNSLEVGSGIGNYKEFKSDIISSDIHNHPWIDLTLDAHRLPFRSSSLSNIVLFDAIHHLYNPVMFLEETFRVLKNGGRLVMIEPFPSPFSLFVYKKFHPEPFNMNIDYFAVNDLESKSAWDANQAIPYLLFYKGKDRLKSMFKDHFKIIKRKKFSFIFYPLTGGFENKQMISDRWIPVIKLIETILTSLNWLMAFRCYIVLQKSAD